MFSEGLGRIVERDESSGSLIVYKPGDNSTIHALTGDEELLTFFATPKRYMREEDALALNLTLKEAPTESSP